MAVFLFLLISQQVFGSPASSEAIRGIVPLEKVSPFVLTLVEDQVESGARSPEISTGQKPESELFPLPFVLHKSLM